MTISYLMEMEDSFSNGQKTLGTGEIAHYV